MRRADLHIADQAAVALGHADLERRVAKLLTPIVERVILEEQLKVAWLVKMAECVGEGARAELGHGAGIGGGCAAIADTHGSSPATSGQPFPVSAMTLNKRPISPSSHSRRLAADMLSVSAGFLAAKAIARAPMPSVSSQVPWLTTRLGLAPPLQAASASAAKSTWAVRSCSPGRSRT